MEADSSEWLFSILQQVQLEQFYVRIRDHLQISRLSHFDYVTPEDLEKVNCYSLNLKRKDISITCILQRSLELLLITSYAKNQYYLRHTKIRASGFLRLFLEFLRSK